MIYFLVHIGKLPAHLTVCVDQILKIDSCAKVYVCSNTDPCREDITFVHINDLQLPNLGNYLANDPDPLWYTSLLRIFTINSFIQQTKESIIHFDNDVLIYEPFDKIANALTDEIYITPHKNGEYTFGYSFIDSIDKFNILSQKIYETVVLGESNVKQVLGETHEMRLLGYCGIDIVTDLPVHPTYGNINGYIFDPSSYGQYIGGTPAGHAPGFIDKQQIVGNIIDNNSVIQFNGKPTILYKDTQYPIFNLHIHSKNLQQFI